MKSFFSSKLSVLYLFSIILLFLYSYTQVDLGLTLTRVSFWQQIQRAFQYVGYFNRPLSAVIFICLTAVFFILYITFLILAKKRKIGIKQLWFVIIVQTIILTFSYNAFSYDIFNYIFDARIVTHYHQNPYFHAALDFPSDPMLHFMHWTQRRLPYGPTWLFITLPFSFLGFQYFLPTFFLFKALISGFYLISVYYLSKIVKILTPKDDVFGIVLFALNPLIVIESLVSSHNEIVSVGLSLISIYLLLNNKNIRSIIVYIISIFLKYTTLFLIPLYFIFFLFKKKKIRWAILFDVSILFMVIAVVLESIRTNFQPWYLVSVLILIPLGQRKIYTIIPSMLFSFFALMQYVPFLYLGNWDPPVPAILNWILVVAGIISVAVILLQKSRKMLQLK